MVFLAVVALAGCGAQSSPGSDTSNTSSGGSAGTTGTGTTGAGGVGCPDRVPNDGSPCSIESGGFPSAHCSWGDDPRPECRTRGVCNAQSWTIQEPFDPNCEEEPLPAACSTTPPESGTVCEMANLECWYEDAARCTCSPCEGGSEYPLCREIDPPEWACTKPGDGCPVPLPQAGTPCDDPDASCGLDCELPIVCQDGVWQWGQGMCPICAAPDTPIATPSGEQPIATLRVGDPVYTVEDGAVVVRPVVRIGSTPVRAHQVLRVVLDSGATLEMSPGHPTADGRVFQQLAAGDWLDATHRVVSSTLVPFDAARTYDIVPASRSGSYFAAGALVGSTLAR